MPSLETWEVLKSLGFIEDEGVFSDPPGGLSIHIGGFKLSASVCINLSFHPVILFTGVFATKRKIGEINFEMPREVESDEQATAWLAWSLDQQIGPNFVATDAIPWLEIGRRNYDLLPWKRRHAAYESRTQCHVDRDWMRLALQKLRLALTLLPPDEMVYFGFDGEILKIETTEGLIAMPGVGIAWPLRASVSAAKLVNLPRRLTVPSISVSYWEGNLRLGNHMFQAEQEEVLS
ncbi:MAG: hypothetical protein EA399_07835 [Desulfovibrionales bacterium]|nr:MAG: hypothetical protein EA399_07835 [Desulfovibrionales bacterium]